MFCFPDDYEWFVPWRALTCDEIDRNSNENSDSNSCKLSVRQILEDQLSREMSPQHVLFGETCRATGVSIDDPREIVFTTANPAKPIAMVRLCWSDSAVPADPFTKVFAELWEWSLDMKLESEEYVGYNNSYNRVDDESWQPRNDSDCESDDNLSESERQRADEVLKRFFNRRRSDKKTGQ